MGVETEERSEEGLSEAGELEEKRGDRTVFLKQVGREETR